MEARIEIVIKILIAGIKLDGVQAFMSDFTYLVSASSLDRLLSYTFFEYLPNFPNLIGRILEIFVQKCLFLFRFDVSICLRQGFSVNLILKNQLAAILF